MNLDKLLERYQQRVNEDRRDAANSLAADMLAIISEGGEPTFVKPYEPIPNRKKLPLKPLSEFPEYVPEAENPNILIKGRWLERGGSAWWISTAGTGKSIASIQLSLLWSEGLPFAGLEPNGKHLNIWIIQSEDSPSRVTIDREDIISELTIQHPEIDWRETAKRVQFVHVGPHVGSDFLERLDSILSRVQRDSEANVPDVIVINPFLAYIGGPVTDGTFVTPFLRGGEINRKPTVGLQAILEKYDTSALIFHHTPKPPTEKELDGWMKSQYPEYQGAGSSDITNWGRSFITMMKVKDDPRKVMLTAGKNGGEIGWETIDGAKRHFLSFVDGQGVTGKHRHAWRELTEDELADVKDGMSSTGKKNIDPNSGYSWLCQNVRKVINMTEVEVRKFYRSEIDSMGGKTKYSNITSAIETAVSTLFSNPPEGCRVVAENKGRRRIVFD